MNDCVKEERRKRSNSVISPTSTIHFVATCLHLIDKYELATATFGPVFFSVQLNLKTVRQQGLKMLT